MSEHLVFPDPLAYEDLRTVVRRVRTADPEAAVRLVADGDRLAVWAAVLPGSGLLAEGAAVGIRGILLAQPAQLDRVVATAALTDRFAHDGQAATRLAVPPATVFAPWAGALPGRSGWEPAGRVDPAELDRQARAGIAEIAQTPATAGTLAVQELRRRVWARPVPVESDPAGPSVRVPAGAAFAAHVLGFVRPGDDPVAVYRHGSWVRLRARGGDVVAR